MARLSTKCGTEFIVDFDFWRTHRNRSWYLLNTGYPASGGVAVHRMVMGAVPPNMVVDHINGNKLDNRQANLQVVSQSQNVARSGHKRNKYRGVGWSKQKQLWRARIVHNYQDIHIGFFNTEEAAARAYDVKARELFGEFASLNFPQEVPHSD